MLLERKRFRRYRQLAGQVHNHSGKMMNSSAYSGGFIYTCDRQERLAKMDERVQKAILFMESNCQRKLRLSQIATSVGVSRSRLSALFLAHLEVSPMRFLKTIRMQQASLLLQSSSLNVKEVAAHSGFNDISHFIRDFIRLYGESPKTVRNGK